MKDYLNTNQLYRDTVRGKISGVCAGIATHFSVDAWIVRIAAIAAFIFMPMVVGVAYLLAVLLIPTR
ncbi:MULTISPECIES: PspC domain-containing protein [Alteromonadaceae]|uniref:PspC domain-containing protein n=1 Tax=Alteromonadaceae TaxID=72275 RepID=UPI001C080A56|nr:MULTISPECIES: PspC domain-containing protein [Aliiglaciecola]MBU2878626.1 PspC domain-containing protein [Aliiglaciecola lipolytica]MDO6709545.1 PspC domain-containing protein [Aliiglaciecola sp. 2_MG-2023]MDO6750913.1 PspC domain-containing protein [Aliiglaciecola sp. 1_MG-2023]